ncbi:N-terminal cleavage protein [Yersinia similis]|uniref:N-terminal cleavage protein n=1 Tax=Yersinia similis TaxID=367190 RepID=A0ABN4CJU3_9GAMM|nr:prepilin peptidase-dependent protein [Yersinia similis]AHK18212.1 N-terminal cleavage protein [Yersinia similis]CFQ56412.1 Prepilin peptidase dependent protein Aprecursor [Yersinia similis]
MKTYSIKTGKLLPKAPLLRKQKVFIKQRSLIKQRGISLIELLVVITLVSVMTLWGGQSWHHYRQRAKLADSARQLLAFLTHLQAEANRNNRTAILWAQPDGQGCLGSGNKPTPPCTGLAGSLFIPPYRDIAITLPLQKEMGFYGVRNTAQAGNIILSSPAGRIRLVISSRGRLRLCSEQQSMAGIHLCL